MTQGSPPEVVRGVVEQVNDKGIKVDGRWLNYSQYREVPHPTQGQTVELEIVRDRFINALKVVGNGAGPKAPARGVAVAASDDPFAGLEANPPARSNGNSDRDQQIRRLALLKAAAEYAASRENSAPEDVVAIAAQWEVWVIGA